MKRLSPSALAACALCVVLVAPAAAGDEDRDYESAIEAYEAGRYQESFIHVKNALQDNPDHIPSRLLLARLNFNEGDIYAVEKECDEALLLGADINLVLPLYGASLLLQNKLDKLLELERVSASFTRQTQLEWALLKGQAYIVRGEPRRARAEFERAAGLFPGDVRATNTLATLYIRYNMLDEAEALLEKSLVLDPANERTWTLRGDLAMRRMDLELARQHYLKAYELDPEDPMVLRGLARVSMRLGDADRLKYYLDLILGQSPDDPAAMLLTAVMQMGGEDGAVGEAMLIELSNKLSNLEDMAYADDANIMFIRATADYVQRKDETARTLLNVYLGKNPDDLIAIRMLTDVYRRNGQDREAKGLLASKRHIIMQDFGLTLQSIQLHIEQGDILAAQELLDEATSRAKGHGLLVMMEAELLKARRQPELALAVLNGKHFPDGEPLAYALLRGDLELQLRRFAEARETVAYLEQRYPEQVRVHNFAAATYLRMEQWDAAERSINRALELDAGNINSRFAQAMLLKYRGELDRSAAVLDGILDEDPEHTASMLLMARVYFEKGDYPLAVEWSERVYAYEPGSTKPDELQYAIHSHTGEWSKARAIALKLTKREPLRTDYLVDLAEAYIALGEFETAQRQLYKLFTLWENDPDKLRHLAGLQVRSENYEGARQSLETALQQLPRSRPIRLGLARVAILEGNPEEAGKIIAQLRTEGGDSTQLATLEGDIALASGDRRAARDAFERAFSLDNRNPDATIKLYQLSMEGIGGEAFTSLVEESLKTTPQPAWVVKLLADSYMFQGRRSEAARHYQTLLTLPAWQGNSSVVNNLANIYAESDPAKGLEVARRGISEGDRSNPALLDTVGWILTRMERYQEALPYFREAYAMNSTDPEIRYHTGVALLALGREKEAERELRAAIATGVEFAGLADARRLVGEL